MSTSGPAPHSGGATTAPNVSDAAPPTTRPTSDPVSVNVKQVAPQVFSPSIGAIREEDRPAPGEGTDFEDHPGDRAHGPLAAEDDSLAQLPHRRAQFPKTFDWALLKPKPLEASERLENLSLAQRLHTLPVLPVPVDPVGTHTPNGAALLRLVEHSGAAHRFYSAGRMAVTVGDIPGKGRHYAYWGPDGQARYIPVDLTDGFTFQPDRPGGNSGMLHWNVPGGQTRIAGRSASDAAPKVVTVPAGTPVLARPGNGTSRWIKLAGDGEWVEVAAGHDVVPALPQLVDRHDDPLFHTSESGDPVVRPEDVRQGRASTCAILAPLKALVNDHPQAIVDMLTDYGDGTVGVRFFVGDRPEWVRVAKQLWVTPDGIGYSIRHEPGKPIWAAMIEKAYLSRFAAGDGYGTPLHSPDTVLRRLGREYHEAGTGVAQPTLTHWEPVLHPFRLGASELRKLLGADADPRFIEQFPGYYDHWRRHVEALRSSTWEQIEQTYPQGPARKAAWDHYLRSEEFDAAAEFRTYLDGFLPAKWQKEKLALVDYYRQLSGGSGSHTLRSDLQKAAGTSFLKRVEYLLRRGTTMVIGTHGFGPEIENSTVVPGLFGRHAYTVLGVEYDAHTGKPARLMLENPHDDNRGYPSPVPGIEYRLDSGGTGYVDDRGVRYRKDEARGIEYFSVGDSRTGRGTGGPLHDIVTDFFTPAHGAEFRRDPDGMIIGLSKTGERYIRTLDGVEYRVMGDHRAWRLADGTEYRLSSAGYTLVKVPGQSPRFYEPGTFHAWPSVPAPKRVGVIAVGLEHLPKFYAVTAAGPGAYSAYGPGPGSPSGTSPAK